MKTIVYIARHSKAFKDLLEEYNSFEIEQIRNEKNPLSVEGEKRAEKLSMIEELRDVEVIYSSHYVRAMSTAKYVCEANNIKLNVDSRLGERKFGVDKISDLPKDFFEKQTLDWDYKLDGGESLNEVSCRMKNCLFDLLDKYNDKTIMIVSHGTALTTMLKDWCQIKYNFDTNLVEVYFAGEMIFDGNWSAPELFRLEFENEKLVDIRNIEVDYGKGL